MLEEANAGCGTEQDSSSECNLVHWLARSELNPTEFDIANREPLKIGFGAHDYFNGSLSDLRIYQRALTDAEVKRLNKEK